jgi:hypothetical protein
VRYQYCEIFHGKMRYQLLDGEIFCSPLEAKVVIEAGHDHFRVAITASVVPKGTFFSNGIGHRSVSHKEATGTYAA